MLRSHWFMVIAVLLGVTSFIGCGTVDIPVPSGPVCANSCDGQQPYVCDEAGESIKAALCGDGYSCDAGACVCKPHCLDGQPYTCNAGLPEPAQPCAEGFICDAGACVPPPTNCEPECGGKECGDDGCTGSCGTCQDGDVCTDGACVTPCVPSCEDGEGGCGDDGCGGECGTCVEGQVCESGLCACVSECEGKACGDDGCGTSCGTCEVDGGESCDASGQCVCTAQDSVGCSEDALATVWLDTCGQVGDTILTCPGGMLCEAGDCACKANHTIGCIEGEPTSLGNYDSCGVFEGVAEECAEGQFCVEGACACVNEGATTCVESTVWAEDTCGAKLEEVETCEGGAVCSEGACVCEEIQELVCSVPPDAEGTNCCSAQETPSCDNEAVVACLCPQDPFCCETKWDPECVTGVTEKGCGSCESADASLQPATVNSCGVTTHLGDCGDYFACEGAGECAQVGGFCDNNADSLLLEAQNVFGDSDEDDQQDENPAQHCLQSGLMLVFVESCVASSCDGDWSCLADDPNPCKNSSLSCEDGEPCWYTGYLDCMVLCEADAACHASCHAEGMKGAIADCVADGYHDGLLVTESCGGCFGDYFGCVLADCYGPCLLADAGEDCMQDCALGTCLPEFFECVGTVQYLCDSYCESKECGDDWCGGSCGSCDDGSTCNLAGECICDCEEVTCESQGYGCGFHKCSETCEGDASGCGNPNEPWAAWNADGQNIEGGTQESIELPVIADQTGHVSNNGSINTSAEYFHVGDHGMVGQPQFEMLSVGVLSFDISSIPQDAVIESATLRVFQSEISGFALFETPNYQAIAAQHIHFENYVWSGVAETLTVPQTATMGQPYVLSDKATVGWRNVDIAPAIRFDRATCRDRVQLRLIWLPGWLQGYTGAGDADVNYVTFNSDDAASDRPALSVTYRIGGQFSPQDPGDPSKD